MMLTDNNRSLCVSYPVFFLCKCNIFLWFNGLKVVPMTTAFILDPSFPCHGVELSNW